MKAGTVASAADDGILTRDVTRVKTCSIDLKTGGLLTISNDIAAANSATVYLTSGAGITEGAAKITTGGALGMSAAGTIAVNSTTNDVATLAASTSSGTLTYQDANALTVGTVAAAGNFTGATGVSTTGGNVTLSSGAAGTGDLTLSQNVSTSGGNAILTALGATSG